MKRRVNYTDHLLAHVAENRYFCDNAATEKPFYIVEDFNEFVPRLVLLNTGELVVVNYCRYGNYLVSSDFKLVGVGCVHDELIEGVKFRDLEEMKQSIGNYEELLLKNRSHILIKTTTDIATKEFSHKYLSDEELKEVLR